jgi:XTP/dITP diphosphohydrolase
MTSAGDPASGGSLVEFVAVMRRLRAECPWKAVQTHASLSRYLLEEAHETLEAIDAGEASGDWDHLREELGDLLLQVYFHAAIAEERGEWTIDDVAGDIVAKLRRRNPHVFGERAGGAGGGAGGAALTPDQVNEEWERRKAEEKSQRTSVTDGLPPGLPALLYADKVLDRLDRLARSGRPEVPSSPRPAPMTSDEVGAGLLALVAEARAAGIDPEQALRHAVRREVEARGGAEA